MTCSLKDWSVHRGHALSLQTYMEGLDLIRGHLHSEDTMEFVELVLSRMPEVPKELLWISRELSSRGYEHAGRIANRLEAMRGGELP
jgi:hypothetical protein